MSTSCTGRWAGVVVVGLGWLMWPGSSGARLLMMHALPGVHFPPPPNSLPVGLLLNVSPVGARCLCCRCINTRMLSRGGRSRSRWVCWRWIGALGLPRSVGMPMPLLPQPHANTQHSLSLGRMSSEKPWAVEQRHPVPSAVPFWHPLPASAPPQQAPQHARRRCT